ncbi:MAG: hypothetical protein QXQ14_01655 [Candidatus Aenigmatarchaeota archaeon]
MFLSKIQKDKKFELLLLLNLKPNEKKREIAINKKFLLKIASKRRVVGIKTE